MRYEPREAQPIFQAGNTSGIIPGVYLLVRLSLVAPVAVQERISGSAAMRRSFALTEGRFWLVFRLGLVLVVLLILPVVVLSLPSAFIPALDHWLMNTATMLMCDTVIAFWSIAFVTAYSHFNNEQTC
jgi:membrane-anchored glycerophosphoryl diester phosphodiesterase (GDPDase)